MSAYIQAVTGLVIPTILSSPYYNIQLLLQTRNEIENNQHINNKSKTSSSSINFIKQLFKLNWFTFLWFGLVYKLISNIAIVIANITASRLFKLKDISNEMTIFKRLPVFVCTVITKDLIAWTLGYFLISGWIWNVTDSIVLTEQSTKRKSHLKKYTFKNVITEIRNNYHLIIISMLLHIANDLVFLAVEFSVDSIFYKIISGLTASNSFQRILLQFFISFICTSVSWPLKTVMFQLLTGQRYKNGTSFKQIINKFTSHFKITNAYNGYTFFVICQILHIIGKLIMQSLNVVNMSREKSK